MVDMFKEQQKASVTVAQGNRSVVRNEVRNMAGDQEYLKLCCPLWQPLPTCLWLFKLNAIKDFISSVILATLQMLISHSLVASAYYVRQHKYRTFSKVLLDIIGFLMGQIYILHPRRNQQRILRKLTSSHFKNFTLFVSRRVSRGWSGKEKEGILGRRLLCTEAQRFL